MAARSDQTGGALGILSETIDRSKQVKSRRWAHTSLHRASATCTMASTWAAEPSFTMPPSHITGIGARWKRFLSRASPMDIPFGSGPPGPMRFGRMRSFGGRDLALEKTAIDY